jgi:dienelactone hydrolase
MHHRDVPPGAPPMFTAIAADDPLFVGGRIDLCADRLAAKRPAELHIDDRGGHGFGMRKQSGTRRRPTAKLGPPGKRCHEHCGPHR